MRIPLWVSDVLTLVLLCLPAMLWAVGIPE